MPQRSSFMERTAMLTSLLFGLLLSAASAQTETVLYNFCQLSNCLDGALPYSGVVFDQQGNLYGTASSGGNNIPNCSGGCGVVFKLTPDGKETALYSFCAKSDCTDGSSPSAGLIFDSRGNLYGTTYSGGSSSGCSSGCGVVFRLTPEGKETVLYSFCAKNNCTDGALPESALLFDQKGNLYGTTSGGGSSNCSSGCGVVFKLTPKGKETVLHTFCVKNNCADGSLPVAGLAFDQQSNLYGTTETGGNAGCNSVAPGCGVVFKITLKGKQTVLHRFCEKAGCTDGANPIAGLVVDPHGNLYGTTLWGPTVGHCHNGSGCGVVFRLSPKGKETVLHTFCTHSKGNACPDGANPAAPLLLDQLGNLYGTTNIGGSSTICTPDTGCGTVFKLSRKNKETVLHSFCTQQDCPDGVFPMAGLTFDQSGNLYGMAPAGGAYGLGVVFELTPTFGVN